MLTDTSTNVFKLQYRKFDSFQMHQQVGRLKELAWGGGSSSMILDPADFPSLFSPGEVGECHPGHEVQARSQETFALFPAV